MGRLHLYTQGMNPYEGMAGSVVTSNPIFTGDARYANFSWSTASAVASRITVQANNGEGFFAALPDEWQDVVGKANAGYFSVDTIPRWIRFQRNPASNGTVRLALHVGP